MNGQAELAFSIEVNTPIHRDTKLPESYALFNKQLQSHTVKFICCVPRLTEQLFFFFLHYFLFRHQLHKNTKYVTFHFIKS